MGGMVDNGWQRIPISGGGVRKVTFQGFHSAGRNIGIGKTASCLKGLNCKKM